MQRQHRESAVGSLHVHQKAISKVFRSNPVLGEDAAGSADQDRAVLHNDGETLPFGEAKICGNAERGPCSLVPFITIGWKATPEKLSWGHTRADLLCGIPGIDFFIAVSWQAPCFDIFCLPLASCPWTAYFRLSGTFPLLGKPDVFSHCLL